MNNQPNLFNTPITTSNKQNFHAQFINAIIALPPGWTGQCEDIRRAWKGEIPHPNAWGSAWRNAIELGLLEDTHEQTSMRARSSHGRKTNLYRKV